MAQKQKAAGEDGPSPAPPAAFRLTSEPYGFLSSPFSFGLSLSASPLSLGLSLSFSLGVSVPSSFGFSAGLVTGLLAAAGVSSSFLFRSGVVYSLSRRATIKPSWAARNRRSVRSFGRGTTKSRTS